MFSSIFNFNPLLFTAIFILVVILTGMLYFSAALPKVAFISLSIIAVILAVAIFKIIAVKFGDPSVNKLDAVGYFFICIGITFLIKIIYSILFKNKKSVIKNE